MQFPLIISLIFVSEKLLTICFNQVKLFEEKITSLENKVAELEEEKGNLLLQILQMEDSMPGSDEQQGK